jgi:hypothetical protein
MELHRIEEESRARAFSGDMRVDASVRPKPSQRLTTLAGPSAGVDTVRHCPW